MNIQTQSRKRISPLITPFEMALLGPLLMIATLFVIFIYPKTLSYQMPLAAICGLILCYRWAWKGVLIALAGLGGIAAYYLHSTPNIDWLFVSTLAFSFGATFVVTALTLDESHQSFKTLSKEAEAQRQEGLQATEAAKQNQAKTQAEKAKLTVDLDEAHKSLRECFKKEQSLEKLIAVARDEITYMHEQNQQLLQELHQAKEQPSKHQEVIQIEDSRVEQLSNDLAAKNALLESLQTEISILKQEKQLLEGSLTTLSTQCEEEPVDLQEVTRLQGLNKQIREQFNEKSKVLDQTRQELFKTQEQLSVFEKEMAEERLNREQEIANAVHSVLDNSEKEIAKVESVYKEEIEALQSIIDNLVASKA